MAYTTFQNKFDATKDRCSLDREFNQRTRYDVQRYSIFEQLTEMQLSFSGARRGRPVQRPQRFDQLPAHGSISFSAT